jgi:hypothetical protein
VKLERVSRLKVDDNEEEEEEERGVGDSLGDEPPREVLVQGERFSTGE